MVTSRTYVASQNGVVVSTRLPANIFSFGPGESIVITGGIELELAVGGIRSRRLAPGDASGARNVKVDKMVSYQVKVNLGDSISDEDHVVYSAAAFNSVGLLSLALMFAHHVFMN